ncbi:hypothetical protein PV10_07864 [Exophiala mesophila]|uniref:Uncharacterized protein n=1 Tax=Exophiala mesophila TaxID=212818 RepID=A0A0D1Z6Y9_EXOME|nr:uncharacterized protein PV10_07864 [Exophiala mesophila]KIV90577.1 hypothetical protein PV10_07864 [Exophiala mesophila]
MTGSTILRLSRRLPTIYSPIQPALKSHFPASSQMSPLRTLSTTRSMNAAEAKKSAVKNREEINTDADEYSQSGTDDATARNEQAAFDPNITDPHEAKKKAGEGNEVNPLEASPANPDLSRGTAEEQGGAKKKMSEGGGGRKGGGEKGKGEQSV